MGTEKSREELILEELAANQIKALAKEYRQTSDVDMESERLDAWFEGFMDVRNSEAKKTASSLGTGVFYRLAAGLILFLMLGSAFAVSTEAIRVGIFNIFTESKEEYTRLEFGQDTNLMDEVIRDWTDAYAVTWVPEGYGLVEANEVNGVKRMLYRYRNDSLTFSQGETFPGEKPDMEAQEISAGEALYYEDSKGSHLVWQTSDGVYLSLRSKTLDQEALVMVAEGVVSISQLTE